MIVYLDVLFLVNVYITYFLLRGTACALHWKGKNLRFLSAAALGGGSSFFIFLPELNFVFITLIKAGLACLISGVAFGFSRNGFLKRTGVFFLLSVALAGAVILIRTLLEPPNLLTNNGFTYIDVSAVLLLISTIIAYFLLRVIRIFLDKRDYNDKKYSVTIRKDGSEVKGEALSDTGNSLVDYFSGVPVIVCEAAFLSSVFPDATKSDVLSGKFRLVPFSTVNGSGLLPVAKADEIIISWEGNEKKVNALVGISDGELKNSEYKAIFNPKLLN